MKDDGLYLVYWVHRMSEVWDDRSPIFHLPQGTSGSTSQFSIIAV
jgi:hypothetical protein